MNNYPCASLLRHVLILILWTHLFLAEIAGLKIDIVADGWKMLGEEYTLGLQAGIIDGIAE